MVAKHLMFFFAGPRAGWLLTPCWLLERIENQAIDLVACSGMFLSECMRFFKAFLVKKKEKIIKMPRSTGSRL